MPPPAGARKGLPYKADAVPLRATRTDLYGKRVIAVTPLFPTGMQYNPPT